MVTDVLSSKQLLDSTGQLRVRIDLAKDVGNIETNTERENDMLWSDTLVRWC